MCHPVLKWFSALLLSCFFLPVHAQCWKSTSEGIFHTLGVKPDGTLWAWGGNATGQLGDGTTGDRSEPIQIGTSSDWEMVAAGAIHSLAIKKDGTLWAWGDNIWGQLGIGSFGNQRTTPVRVGAATNWKSIAAGRTFSLAIRTDGSLWAWGDNLNGQLGNQIFNAYTPQRVGTDTNWKSVSAGGIHTLGIKTDGTLWAWGSNGTGQLGDGTTTDRFVPVRIGTDSDWNQVATGFTFTVALKTNGSLWSWGSNDMGQLGDGTYTNRHSPSQVGTMSWQTVATGGEFTVGIRSDGTLWEWGYTIGKYGMNQENTHTIPTQVGTAANWKSITAGEYHAFAFQTDDTLWGWGNNDWGVLGIGSTEPQVLPVLLFPAAPLAEPTQYFCNAGTVAGLVASGSQIRWYTSPAGGVALSSTVPLINGTHYYASQTKYLCESGRVDVVAQINTTPTPAPVGLSTQYYCSGESIESIEVQGSSIKWYATSLSTQPLVASTLLVGGQHYYATQTVQACESIPRLEVTVSERTTAPPTGPTFQQLCEGNTIANLSANGSNIKWYDEYLQLLPVSTVLVHGKSYFATQTINSAESCSYLGVTVDVKPYATSPLGENYQSFCTSEVTVQNLLAAGSLIRWYDQPVGGVPLSPFDPIMHGKHYFASQSYDYSYVCESPVRMEVVVSINSYAVPPPEHIGYYTACVGATISDLPKGGENIKWYTHFENGPALPPETVLEDNTYYYSSQTINGVESCVRSLAVVTLNHTPTLPPTSAGEQVFCDSGIVASLMASGENLKWYDTPGSTSPLTAGTSLMQKTYYATQTIDGCESDGRLPVAVRINTVHPPAPTGLASQFFCGGKVGDLQASGTAIQWYSSPSETTPLDPSVSLVDGIHYYATQTVDKCWSTTRLDVTASVDPETPRPSVGSVGWEAIVSTSNFTLAIKDGRLWGWGANETGQLGDGTLVDRLLPVLIDPKPVWKAIGAGTAQALGLKKDGTLWNWGEIQPGDGTVIINSVPVQVGSDNDWRSIASGSYYSMAIKEDGTLWAWGHNTYGQLGVSPPDWIVMSPVQVGSDTDWVSVGAGSDHTIGLKADGTLWAWGDEEGVWVDNVYHPQTTPKRIGTDSDWKFISEYFGTSFAIKADGSLWGWGYMVNELWEKRELKRIGNSNDWVSVYGGHHNVVGLKKDGSLWYWRYEYNSVEFRDITKQVDDSNDWKVAFPGQFGGHVFGTRNDGSLWGWGNNDQNQMGIVDGLPFYEKPHPIEVPEVVPMSTQCGSPTLSQLSVYGSNLEWYGTATGPSLAGNTPAVSGAHYFVTQTLGVCESKRQEIIVIDTELTAPTGPSAQTFCAGSTVGDLSAEGTSIQWYGVPSGGTPLLATAPLVNGAHYYGTQTLTGCESPTRLDVVVTLNLNTTTAPTGNPLQTFCKGSVISDLVASGSDVLWYESAAGGIPLAPHTLLINDKHYFASQTVNACESSTRLDVQGIVHETLAPTGPAEQAYCGAVTLAELTVSGSGIRWYNAPAGGTEWESTRPIHENGHYYASQTMNGCESTERLDVSVLVSSTPIPGVEGLQVICFGGTVANLRAAGLNVKWYDNYFGGTPLEPATPLEHNRSYWVSQTIDNCESSRTDVFVYIVPDEPPIVNPSQIFCTGSTVADLTVLGGEIKWYETESGGTPLPAATLLISGKYYYASVTTGPCESLKRSGVLATQANDTTPSGSPDQSFCQGAIVSDLKATGTNIKWYDAPFGGVELPLATALVSGGSYYASQTVDYCESPTRLKTTVSVVPKPPAPSAESPQHLPLESQIDDIQVSGENIKWYEHFSYAQSDYNPLPQTQQLIDGWTYYATQSPAGCRSDPRPVQVLMTITGIEPLHAGMMMYPNPVDRMLSISANELILTVELVNAMGQRLIHRTVNEKEVSIDLSGFPAGVYYVETGFATGGTISRVVKR